LGLAPLPPHTQGPTTLHTHNPWGPNTNDSNTHSVKTLATADVETGLKLCEQRGGQPLGEDVAKLGSGRDVEDTNVLDDNVLTNEVEINLNMLGALVLNGVGGEVDGTDVVTVDHSGPR
jgi:hypothetical protein